MKFIELLEGVNPEWTVKEKARYLYTEICKNILYSETFAYGQDKETLHSIYNRDIDIEKDEDPRLVCRTTNIVYHKLLEKLGIKSKLIYKKTKVKRPIEVEDVALLFWDEDGNKYYTNIIGDVQNCRYGSRTKFFGVTRNLYEESQNVEEITPEELKQIDLKINYIKTDYSDIVFKILGNEVKNTNNFKKFLRAQGIDTRNMSNEEVLEKKIEILTDLIKYRDETAGPDELKKFYQTLFRTSILDKFETKKFEAFEFVKDKEDGVEVIPVIALRLSEKTMYFFFSDEEQTYLQISEEEIIEKLKGYRERSGKKLINQGEKEK